jgi:hypothetical protein
LKGALDRMAGGPDRAARLEAQLAAVRKVQSTLETLRETLTAFPELREDFADEIRLLAVGGKEVATSDAEANGVRVQIVRFTEGTNRDRIRAFLAWRGNKPASIDEIAEATELPESSIRHTFSTRDRGSFLWVRYAGNPLKHWRMVTEADGVRGQDDDDNLEAKDDDATE